VHILLHIAKKDRTNEIWIERISAALRESGMKYSRFIKALNTAKININRKHLAALALDYPKAFAEIINNLK
jgi:large subunit ribosomal protein L20